MDNVVLIADDEKDLAQMMGLCIFKSQILKNQGYTIVQYASKEEDVRPLVENSQPDLILLDTEWNGRVRGPAIYDQLKSEVFSPRYTPTVVGTSSRPENEALWKERGLLFLDKRQPEKGSIVNQIREELEMIVTTLPSRQK